MKVPAEVTALALVSRDLFGTKSLLLSVYTQGLGMEEVEDKNDFLWMEEGDNANFNRQYINSSILKEEYYKISSKNSPTFYIYKNCKANMGIIKEIGGLFKLERWRIIGDLLVMSPYIFSWRD